MIGQATGALMAAIWQGILLAGLVGLGLRLLPKTPAAIRFAIWFGVFLVVTALPVALVWPHAANGAVGGRGAWLTIDERWSLAIAAVWIAASAVRAVTLVIAGFRVRALWKRARAVGSPEVGTAGPSTPLRYAQDDNSHVGTKVGGRRAQLCVSDEVDRPTVIGFFVPKILVPGWLLEKLTPAELEQVVLHESGHLGRADDWMNLLQKIALVIFPLNPALAWVERRLCFERELAVDERVLSALGGKAGAATAYAACLATVAEHRLGRRGFSLALGALGRESELGRRVGRILRRGELMRPAQARLVLGGALLGLFGAAAGLEHCPQVIGFTANTQAVEQADLVNADGAQIARIGMGGLRRGTNTPREVLMKASVSPAGGTDEQARPVRVVLSRLASVGAGGGLVASEGQPTLRDEAAKDGPPRVSDGPTRVSDGPSLVSGGAARFLGQAHSVATRAEVQSARVVRQLVVVTEWQSEDGLSRTSRVVMTSATTENPAARAQRTQSDVEQSGPDAGSATQQDLEQFHRYAAVPVRGGWLVFQL